MVLIGFEREERGDSKVRREKLRNAAMEIKFHGSLVDFCFLPTAVPNIPASGSRNETANQTVGFIFGAGVKSVSEPQIREPNAT